jgi:hypothetical protein
LRTPKNADMQTIATTNLVALNYTVPVNTVSTAKLVLTNLASTTNAIEVYINDGLSDFLLAKNTLSAGNGKTWRVLELSDEKLNAGFSVKVKAAGASGYNAFLSVSEVN